jgi:hypothetical protein
MDTIADVGRQDAKARMAASAGDGRGRLIQKQRIIAESFAPGTSVAEVGAVMV